MKKYNVEYWFLDSNGVYDYNWIAVWAESEDEALALAKRKASSIAKHFKVIKV